MKYQIFDKEIQSIAPLWLDPADIQQNRKPYFLILLLPFFIFLIMSGLIFYSWILGNLIATPASNPLVYLTLYFLGSIGFSSESPHDVINDAVYSSMNWPVSLDESDNIGLNVLDVLGIVNTDRLIKDLGIPIEVITDSLVPLYFVFPMMYTTYLSQPTIFIILFSLLAVHSNELLSVLAELVLFFTRHRNLRL